MSASMLKCTERCILWQFGSRHLYVKQTCIPYRAYTRMQQNLYSTCRLSMLRTCMSSCKTPQRLKVIISKCFRCCSRTCRFKLVPTNTKSISPYLRLLIKPVGTGGIFSALCLKRHFIAECQNGTTVQRTRMDGMEARSKSPDPSFNWRELFRLLWPEIWYLLAAVASAIAAAIVNIQIPLNMGELVNVISGFTRETAHNFLQDVKEPSLRLLTLYGVQGLLTFTYITLLGSLGERFAARLRTQLFNALLQQDIEFYDSHKTGELIDRLTSDVQDFKSSFKLCISQGLRAFTQTAGCVVTLLIISPKLTGIMLVVVPLIISAGSLLGHNLRKLSRAAQAQVALATAVADEAIGNVRTVRAFAMEQKENELYSREVQKSAVMNVRLSVGIGVFQGLANMSLNGIVLGVLFAGGSMMASGELTPGDLMSFLMATQTIERSLAHMSLLFGQVIRGTSAGARVFEFATLRPKIPLEGGKKIPVHSLIGNIEFKHVSFSYPTRPEQEVLHDFSLCVPGGKVVALVGLSGGGKSTIAALLERFYEVTRGEISIDGHNLKSLDPTWLRGRAIGFINQEPVLFATTVRENIRYGYPEASDEEILEASKLANAHDFISQFPQGYDTVLGERGVTVSGGQKQRIAIARALIKNPSILILDEATSALDAESERIVQEALDKVIKGHTVLIIAHRLSTIKDADIIAVVSNGKIVEMGHHDELRRRRGLYWELIKQQHVEEEIEDFEKRFFGQ